MFSFQNETNDVWYAPLPPYFVRFDRLAKPARLLSAPGPRYRLVSEGAGPGMVVFGSALQRSYLRVRRAAWEADHARGDPPHCHFR